MNEALHPVETLKWCIYALFIQDKTKIRKHCEMDFWMVSFTILYLSFLCYSLYDVVITRARSSRTEGSRWLVVVLLVVF